MNNIAKRIRLVPNSHCTGGIRDFFMPYLDSKDEDVREDASEEWFDCREFFHNTFDYNLKKERGYFFGAVEAEIRSIASMFEFVEAILNLKSCYRSTIYRCKGTSHIKSVYNQRRDANSAAFIDLSPFWLSSKTRAQFSTILTRAAARKMIARVVGSASTYDQMPDPDEYDNPKKKATLTYRTPLQAIMRVDYCRETPRATAMFLDGYTLFRPATKIDHCESNYDGTFNEANIIRCFNDSHWVSKFTFDITPKCANRLVRPTRKRDLKWFRRNDPRSLLTTHQRRQLIAWINKEEESLYNDDRHILPASATTFAYVKPAARKASSDADAA